VSGSKKAQFAPSQTQNSSSDGVMTMVDGQDRFGDDLTNYENIQSAEQCRDLCMQNSNCKAYTWLKPSRKDRPRFCYLKSGPGNIKSDSSCVSGVKQEVAVQKAPAQPFVPQNVKVVAGGKITYEEWVWRAGNRNTANYLAKVSGPKAATCQTICLSDLRCKSYSYYNDSGAAYCFTMDHVGAPEPVPHGNPPSGSAHSGVKIEGEPKIHEAEKKLVIEKSNKSEVLDKGANDIDEHNRRVLDSAKYYSDTVYWDGSAGAGVFCTHAAVAAVITQIMVQKNRISQTTSPLDFTKSIYNKLKDSYPSAGIVKGPNAALKQSLGMKYGLTEHVGNYIEHALPGEQIEVSALSISSIAQLEEQLKWSRMILMTGEPSPLWKDMLTINPLLKDPSGSANYNLYNGIIDSVNKYYGGSRGAWHTFQILGLIYDKNTKLPVRAVIVDSAVPALNEIYEFKRTGRGAVYEVQVDKIIEVINFFGYKNQNATAITLRASIPSPPKPDPFEIKINIPQQ
jgi:hypothetical protein